MKKKYVVIGSFCLAIISAIISLFFNFINVNILGGILFTLSSILWLITGFIYGSLPLPIKNYMALEYYITDSFYDNLENGKFDLVKTFLKKINMNKISPNCIKEILFVTFPFAEQLGSARLNFISMARESLNKNWGYSKDEIDSIFNALV